MFVNKVFDFPFQIKLFHLITKYIEFYYNLKFHLNILNNATDKFGDKTKRSSQSNGQSKRAKRSEAGRADQPYGQSERAKRSVAGRADKPIKRTERAGEAVRAGVASQMDKASGRSGASGQSERA